MAAKYTVAETGPRLDAFLRSITSAAGLVLSWEIGDGGGAHPDFETPDLTVKFSGADVDILLGNKAELLLALEHLAMESLRMTSDEHSRLCFDANDYRMLRIEELRVSAATAAERVKKSRMPFHFSPMNSRERRIIHLALRDETEVRSESVGAGPFRQVVVMPADMKTPPPPQQQRPGPPMRRSGGGMHGGPPRFGDRGGDRGGDRRGPRPDRRGGGRDRRP